MNRIRARSNFGPTGILPRFRDRPRFSALEVFLSGMRYINPLYLLNYLLL